MAGEFIGNLGTVQHASPHDQDDLALIYEVGVKAWRAIWAENVNILRGEAYTTEARAQASRRVAIKRRARRAKLAARRPGGLG